MIKALVATLLGGLYVHVRFVHIVTKYRCKVTTNRAQCLHIKLQAVCCHSVIRFHSILPGVLCVVKGNNSEMLRGHCC